LALTLLFLSPVFFFPSSCVLSSNELESAPFGLLELSMPLLFVCSPNKPLGRSYTCPHVPPSITFNASVFFSDVPFSVFAQTVASCQLLWHVLNFVLVECFGVFCFHSCLRRMISCPYPSVTSRFFSVFSPPPIARSPSL